MSDTIDELIDDLGLTEKERVYIDAYSKGYNDGYSGARKIFRNKRKKGHWVENHDSDRAWKCSECGCGYTDSKLSFCYDCGSDMRGESDG